MNTLRAKIALLLVTSIVSVMVLITLAVMYIFATPKDMEVDLLAKQLIILDRLGRQNPEAEGLSRHPDTGALDKEQTELMRAGTMRFGVPVDVTVTHKADDGRFSIASIRVGSQSWLLVDIDPPSDPELWVWITLITIGAGSIAVFAAHRMTKPLALLESAAESVRPDGSFPTLSEQGPAEVRATAAAINSLSSRLKRATESRMRLVAAAGHDFRTPLTRMRLRAEFVTDDEDRALWLKDIEELDRIADSAIELVRDETTKAPPELIRLDDLVKNIVAELQEQNLAIEVADAGEAYVKASRLALSRALRNLFINAATHGERGVVSVTGGSTARIVVSDRGPGIAADLLDQVFEPFFRADRARGQKVPGAGLGLTISREIVRRDGGDIRIANQPNGGLVQVVELPTADPQLK
ncbi:ATP-binding protein [Hyphomicrobium sp.]|uniref:ATP-binding protein n=1 Tax=Hyphomicrobium sp. TaxID=82 RepID=UPI002E35ED7A|nr:ATP-binding protein [Hyphomicrobium sp.]HEX2841348.1 ATP-binding protein [Hyphomicrobium sp.]